jgi:preprotein translocase subunit SecF
MSKSATADSSVLDTVKDGPLDVYKYRWLFLGISLLFLVPGIYFLIANCFNPELQSPLRLGIDFRGGTLLEYGFSKPVTQEDVNDIRLVFDKHNYTGSVIQIQQPREGINAKPGETPTASDESETKGQPEAEEKTSTVSVGQGKSAASPEKTGIASIVSVRSKHIQGHDDVSILNDLQSKFGHITLLQKNSIGPALAKELLLNGALALLLAYLLILGYLTFRFQFDFAICAMLALVHDTIFIFGTFAAFGALFHTEVDSLFVTAILTVVGFSVHDTIVVFDRIRENNRLLFTKKVPFVKIVNMSVNQTLARSINTSLTVLLTMLAMYFFGGETTRDFVLTIIIGVVAGTYSSIFNASVLLAMWRNRGQAVAQASA